MGCKQVQFIATACYLKFFVFAHFFFALLKNEYPQNMGKMKAAFIQVKAQYGNPLSGESFKHVPSLRKAHNTHNNIKI